ncbi:hypothetical protein MWU78_16125 [Arenibacter sp. F26102]|uniref:hypothetical protein n=1 Tax=Arenibacter sp. F26102 TaxID=2926416 RepID=UPI001FF6DA72|nr:hypothetical protein [Arenibacter sp. F26102]MCK0147186.1 hypothetical protein [Arenibacter sp. F26102]
MIKYILQDKFILTLGTALKSIVLILALIGFLLGCSSDDSSTKDNADEVADVIDDGEENTDGTDGDGDDQDPGSNSTSASSNELSDQIIMGGSTKVQGAPPTSNGAISLDILGPSSNAYIIEGFDIPVFSSDGDIAGAYVQFKVKDSIAADSYFDVDVIQNASNKKEAKFGFNNSRFSKNYGLNSKIKASYWSINVNFDPQLTSGEFCYVIWVYDNQGNISVPKEECVTIKAWGGNEALIANWSLTSYEELYEGQLENINAGEEYCDGNYCQTLDYVKLNLNTDGTFSWAYRYDERDVNGSYGQNTWSVATTFGNWAYEQNESRLLFFEYKYTEEDVTGIVYEDVNAPGRAYVVFKDSIDVNATNLIILDELDNDADGHIDGRYQENYEKL